MTRWLAELAAPLALLLMLCASHSVSAAGDLDDLAVLRASAWLSRCAPGDALPQALRKHLDEHSAGLPLVARERFRLRSSFVANYGLTAPLVRLFEHAGAVRGLTSVRAACLVQHVLVAVALLLLVRQRTSWLLLALLGSALPALRIWPAHLGQLAPFQRDDMTWLTAVPRGAAVLAWFGALVSGFGFDRPRRLWLAAGFAVASLACHRSMALLCFGSSMAVLTSWFAVRDRIRWRPQRGAWLAAFTLLGLAVAALKVALLLHYDSQRLFPLVPPAPDRIQSMLRPALTLVVWGIASAVLLWTWLSARVAPNLAPALRRDGDALAVLLGVTAAVAWGLNAAHPGTDLWYGPLFLVTEASIRLSAVPQLLFFCSLGLTLWIKAPALVRTVTPWLGVAGCLLALAKLVRHEDAPVPQALPTVAALLARGSEAYTDEVRYYLSVAQEIGSRGCNAR